jgi:uncharacterized protein (TIGR00369 family)
MGSSTAASSYDELLGLEIVACGEELVRARLAVHDGVKQPMGLVHGGVYASLAEAMVVGATRKALGDPARIVRGLSTQTSFLRPGLEGTLHATARRRHRGRTTWVWETEVADDRERLCALVRVTVQIAGATA